MHRNRVVTRAIAMGLVTIILYVLGGCATIFKGSNELVDFYSNPTGAQVYVNGNLMGKTPTTLELQSKSTYVIEFRKEGYEPSTYQITNYIGAGWIVLDVLFGLVPVVVDAATGAWYRLDQDAVDAVLERQQ